jgi:co-chaperonin GroES (HSP10)
MPKLEDKTKGGIIIPDGINDREATASIIGFVTAMGPLCYKDDVKFPTGAWCKVGDFVMFRSYSGTRFKIEGEEFRLINDDTVEAVVDDPRKFRRA